MIVCHGFVFNSVHNVTEPPIDYTDQNYLEISPYGTAVLLQDKIG